MADQKVTALVEEVAPILTDLLYMVDDPGVTPISKKVTMQNVLDVVNFVGFFANLSGGQSVDSGSVDVVEFDTEVFDAGGYFNVATYRWTPPAGYVVLYTSLHYDDSTRYGQWARVDKNGVQIASYCSRPPDDADGCSAHVMILDEADGDDYYEAIAFHYKGSAITVNAFSQFLGFAIPQG